MENGNCGEAMDSRLMETSTANVDIRVRVTGGGHTSQIYAIRQAIAKSIVSLPLTLPWIYVAKI